MTKGFKLLRTRTLGAPGGGTSGSTNRTPACRAITLPYPFGCCESSNAKFCTPAESESPRITNFDKSAPNRVWLWPVRHKESSRHPAAAFRIRIIEKTSPIREGASEHTDSQASQSKTI
jgi:hypothetical protein